MRKDVIAIVSLAVLASIGCRPKKKDPWATPVGDTKTTQDDGFAPAHAGHVNQREPGGGFRAAKEPPPPVAKSSYRASAVGALPAPAAKKAPPKAGKGHCGEVDIGHGQKILLDCMTEDYGKVKSAALPLVSHDEMTGSAGVAAQNLPKFVDNRQDGSEGPVMHQGHTLACTAFSLVTAANHSVAKYLGHPGNLSPMHSWARYHTPQMRMADELNIGHGLADSTVWPFDEKLANAWQESTKPVDSTFLRSTDSKAVIQIANITKLAKFSEIKSSLAAHQDVWFALRAAHYLNNLQKGENGSMIVPDYDWKAVPAAQQMGHAIVLAGYQDTNSGTFYLVHNSWGTDWGEKGYAWIHETTLARNLSDAYVVDAHPVDVASAKVAPAVHKFSSCEAGLAPDAITSQCAPKCPDGGPRSNGACPVASHCPPGEVNLHGACTLAAPTVHKTTTDGIQVDCGPSGCTYGIPPGKTCTQKTTCHISCPAPRYRIANGPRGLTCTG